MLSTIAGTTDVLDGRPGPSARFYHPTGIAADGQGSLYIADQSNNRIRRLRPDGTVSTVAGTGVYGASPDGSPAATAMLSYPQSIVRDNAGNLYFSQIYYGTVRRITAAGFIDTIAGVSGTSGYNGESGIATAVHLNQPSGLAMDGAGNLYIADTENHRVRKVSPAGILTTVAGAAGGGGYNGDDAPATTLLLNRPTDVAVDAAGRLYIADSQNYRIRRVAFDGIMTTVAGNGQYNHGGEGVPAASSPLAYPNHIALDSTGNVFVTERCRVRKISPAGVITTVAGIGYNCVPSGENVPTAEATLHDMEGIVSDGRGTLYVSEAWSNRVRKILTGGPNGNDELFVRQLYVDLLNREADNGGAAYWAGGMASGYLTRQAAAAAFFTSNEFSATGLSVIKLYLGVLGRDPDFSGWWHWFTALRSGVPYGAMLEAFLGAPEFAARFGNPDDTGFVTVIYRNILGRDPDAGGLAYWTAHLGSGALTRAQLIDSFLRSPEFDGRVRNRCYAMLLYMGFLRRSPESAGLEYWAGVLNDGAPLPDAVASFIGSVEYRGRF